MPLGANVKSIIFKHDIWIAIAGVRDAFSKWSDLLTLVLGMPVLILAARVWILGLPGATSELFALVISFFIHFSLARLAANRLCHHRTDGVLAVFALRDKECIRYLALFTGVGLAAALAILLVVGAGGAKQLLFGAVLGVIAGLAWGRLFATTLTLNRLPMPISNRVRGPHRAIFLVLGALSAGVTLVALNMVLDQTSSTAITMLVALSATVVLGSVDSAQVRFMTLVGHSSLETLRFHFIPIVCFFLPFVLILLISSNWLLPVIGAGTGILLVAVVIVRVLAYRAYRRQFADWATTLLLVFVAVVALSIPFAAPVAYLAAVFWLSKRASGQTWLIA